jgi:hypothetical protein
MIIMVNISKYLVQPFVQVYIVLYCPDTHLLYVFVYDDNMSWTVICFFDTLVTYYKYTRSTKQTYIVPVTTCYKSYQGRHHLIIKSSFFSLITGWWGFASFTPNCSCPHVEWVMLYFIYNFAGLKVFWVTDTVSFQQKNVWNILMIKYIWGREHRSI